MKHHTIAMLITLAGLLAVCASAMNGPRPRRPRGHSWAPFFTDEEYDAFMQVVADYFKAKGTRVTMGDGVVTTRDGKHQLGLLNIAQSCARSARSEWSSLIAAHFDSILSLPEKEQITAEAYDKVKDLLAIRLWPDDIVEQVKEGKLIYRRDLAGTVSVLVYDLPTSVRNVLPDDIQAWGKTPDELFTQALDNTLAKYRLKGSQESLADDVKVWIFVSDNFFVASQALLIEEYPECLGRYGALVGVPVRGVMLCYPINDDEMVKAVTLLIPALYGMERDGPGSISPKLYWYDDGRFVDLPYELTEAELHFLPPEPFVRMLNRLVSDTAAVDDEMDSP